MFYLINKTTWAVFFAFTSMFILGISDNIRGPLYPELIKHFTLSNSQAAWSFAFSSTAAVLANAAAAFALKKIHLDRLMAIAVFLLIVGPLTMGLATSYQVYLTGAIFLGFSFGVMGVAQNLLIAENTDGLQQTRALSGLHSVYGFSSLIAPLLASRAPSWFAENYGQLTYLTHWQSAFFIVAIFYLIIAILLYTYKHQWIKIPVSNFIITKMLKKR